MAGFSDERIRAIIEGKKTPRAYPFPGTTEADEVSIGIRTLTEHELDGCRSAAQRFVRATAKKRGWKVESYVEVDPAVLDRAVEHEVIWRATLDPETLEDKDPARFFESVDVVRKLDSVTTTMLASLYLEHQEWTNPLLTISQDAVEELVEQLGKVPAPQVFLHEFAPNTLRRFVISMASILRSET